MPVQLRHAGTIYAENHEFSQSAIAILGLPDGRFSVLDYSTGVTRVVSAGAFGPRIDASWWHEAEARPGFQVIGHAGTLPPALVNDLQANWAADGRSGQLAFLGEGAHQSEAAIALAAELNGVAYLFVGASDGSGLSGFTLNDDGAVQTTVSVTDNARNYLKNVSDMALTEVNGAAYLYAGSATEHGISGFRVGSDGALEPVESFGMAQSLPVRTVTALETAEVAGHDFLLVAGAGSSSLSVLAVGVDGTLSVRDHVIDDLPTRFSGVTQLEVVSVDGHVFVLAAGDDDGLSLFRLTAEGRLVHLDTMPDGLDRALNGVSGLAAQADDNGLTILTTSAGEGGLSLFRVDFSNPGVIEQATSAVLTGTEGDDLLSLRNTAGEIRAGAGDDVLSDGAGADTLEGGDGADIFVLRADGQRDVILDIQVGEDVLDLSAWPFLRNIDQIEVRPTERGAMLRFAGEELDLRSHDGTSLEADDIAALLSPFLSHVTVERGPLQTAPPEPIPVTELPPPPPAPEPEPEPEPEPDPVPPANNGQTSVGTNGADLLEGSAENDMLAGRGGNDTLRGLGGDDTLAASDGDDLVEGGAGHDNIGGGPGDDTLRGQAGRDTLGGGLGDDLVEAGDDHDVVSGGPGNDLVSGGAGDDTLAGSFGADTVLGNAGDDSIGGGPGSDMLDGGAGNDRLGGGEGNDTVDGGGGDDFLAGGGRHDLLRGGSGRDTLNGGAGNDRLEGGGGADLFVFNELNDGEEDVIVGFQPEDDRIRLSGVEGQGQNGRFQALDIIMTGQGAEVHYEGHTILFEGLAIGALSADDFIFL